MSEGERHETFFNFDEWQSIYRSLLTLTHICKKVANNLHVAFLIPQNLLSCIIEKPIKGGEEGGPKAAASTANCQK